MPTELIELLKIELGIDASDSTKDALLTRYLNKATKRIINLTRRDKVYIEENLQDSVIDIATIYYNRKGTEGLKSQGYSGASESYLEDIPEEIKRDLYEHRLLGGAR